MTWVYKPDGSKQCTGIVGTTAEAARAELASLVGGEAHISKFGKVALLVIQVCNLPTGICHVADLDDAGLNLLMTGFSGPSGWTYWPFADDPSILHVPDQHELRATLSEPGVPFPMKFHLPEIEQGTAGTVTFEQGRAAVLPEMFRRLTSVSSAPSSLRDLIGKKLHVVHDDDPKHFIYYEGRAIFHVDADDRIVDINFH